MANMFKEKPKILLFKIDKLKDEKKYYNFIVIGFNHEEITKEKCYVEGEVFLAIYETEDGGDVFGHLWKKD